MILFAHMLLGAVVGSKIHSIPLAIILALLCHYFLDLFPHIEYPIEQIKEKNWKHSLGDFTKVAADFFLGILAIYLVSSNQPMVYICAIVAILPDGATLISSVFPSRPMALHDDIHTKKIHFLKYKKISVFWRILTQAISIATCTLLLFWR